MFDVEEALADGRAVAQRAPRNEYFTYEGHHCRRIRFGDVDPAFAAADHVSSGSYQSAPIEHAPTETTGCIVVPQPDGRLRIHSDTQACFFTLDNTALILDTPFNKLRLIGGTVGGGFGGKVDVIVEPIACIAAMATNRPVKYVYSRQEEMQVSSPRAAERIYIKDGVMDDGRIVARKVTLYVDAGAYSRHSPYGTTKAAAHMPGPYNDPERVGRCALRLHQPHALQRNARVRRDNRRLRARDPDRPDRAGARHGPAAAATQERLP